MKLGIMQPYFFPYLGYFDLINRTDQWVVFDVVKYTPKTWMNRNRILHPSTGWQYISAPVDKQSSGGMIKDTLLVSPPDALERILGQIDHYRTGGAPYYKTVRELIITAFGRLEGSTLGALNVAALRTVCEYLSIPFEYAVLSEMKLELPPIRHPGQWALEISAALGADEYLNPSGGRSIFVEEEFRQRGIKLSFLESEDFTYDCGAYEFIPHLSIIDVLMWNSPAAIGSYLDRRAGPESPFMRPPG